MFFTKMQVNGNDYIYVNNLNNEVKSPNLISKRLSHRRFGIGADGLVLISQSTKADCRMSIYNADGSNAEICGNALLSVGMYLYENNIVNSRKIYIETDVGIKKLKLILNNNSVEQVEASMGEPNFISEQIPVMTVRKNFINRMILLNGDVFITTCLSMGNPHAVILRNNILNIDIDNIGKQFQAMKIFPKGINIEFIRIVDKETIEMRVYERGVGETWSCGSGCCAAVAVAVMNRFCKYDTDIKLLVKGGDLVVKYLIGGSIIIKGRPKVAYKGCVDLT